MPLIVPPTPPVLEADKEAIAAEFAKVEQFLKQLQVDTEELKVSERERLNAVDEIVQELDVVLKDAKSQLKSREEEMKQLKSEIEILRTELPRFLDRASEGQKNDLLDIQNELKSLKQILSNRLRSTGPAEGDRPSPTISSATLSSTLQTPVSTMKPPSRAGIPSWQLAAANKFKESNGSAESTSSSSQTDASTAVTTEQ
ncbi:hypothetical protein V1514DRAFT_327843 [Lipomyces japonicus]|uniref:uncharacterized protein n=1 Tax=Lipomyces japonicus TaxID=56871 RepID=UPI0034CFF611